MREQQEPTAVDDVRRVRERLAREAGGDIRRQAADSMAFAAEAAARLGLLRAASAAPKQVPGDDRAAG